MITLSRSLSEDLAACALLHRRLCPRQVLGVRMARYACVKLGVDPAIERKQVFVFMECGRCPADAVMAVTGASPTNELMQLMGYGKVAATFVNLHTGEAVRICEHSESRKRAGQLMPHLPEWEAQRECYQAMPENELLQWQWVKLLAPLPSISEKHCVVCERCEARINEGCEVVIAHCRGTQVLCRACAYGAYYQSMDVTVEQT